MLSLTEIYSKYIKAHFLQWKQDKTQWKTKAAPPCSYFLSTQNRIYFFFIFLAALQKKIRFLNGEEWRYFVLLIILIHIIYCTKRSTHFLYLRFGQEFQFGCLYLGLCLKYSCNATILHILVQYLQYCLRIE